VLELIGRGAMGVVYKARDPLLDRVVAIKTINAPAALGERVRKAFLERFEREAKAAAGISHPAIVTIFDVGLDLENPYLVMEYLPGETLADRLDRGRIPLPLAFEAAREIAGALGGHYLPLPHADASTLQRAVQAATGG
jgi:serine/threonine-protein kinase